MELLHDMLEQIERQRLTKMVNEIPDHDILDSRLVASTLSLLYRKLRQWRNKE